MLCCTLARRAPPPGTESAVMSVCTQEINVNPTYTILNPPAACQCGRQCWAGTRPLNGVCWRCKQCCMQVETLIGYGSPNKANTHGVHGAPLGGDETALTREQLKWKYGEFEIPDEVSRPTPALALSVGHQR